MKAFMCFVWNSGYEDDIPHELKAKVDSRVTRFAQKTQTMKERYEEWEQTQ